MMQNCPECHRELSDAAVACPNCGRPLGRSLARAAVRGTLVGAGKLIKGVLKAVGTLLIFFFIGSVIGGVVAAAKNSTVLSKVDSQVSNFKVTHDSEFIDGDLDYGVRVTFDIHNTGGEGTVEVDPYVDCSEGHYTRRQTIHLDANETRTLTYFFKEPTINAENIEGGVKANH